MCRQPHQRVRSVAVGMPITRHPPHRSGQPWLPHQMLCATFDA